MFACNALPLQYFDKNKKEENKQLFCTLKRRDRAKEEDMRATGEETNRENKPA